MFKLMDALDGFILNSCAQRFIDRTGVDPAKAGDACLLVCAPIPLLIANYSNSGDVIHAVFQAAILLWVYYSGGFRSRRASLRTAFVVVAIVFAFVNVYLLTHGSSGGLLYFPTILLLGASIYLPLCLPQGIHYRWRAQ